MAIREGLKLPVVNGYQRVEVEMDSKIIHSEIKRQRGVKQWMVWPVVRDIKCLLNQILEKKILLIRRNANNAAD